MTTPKSNLGDQPAFPIPPVGTGDPRDGMSRGSDGVSTRLWLARAAMQGLLANPKTDIRCKPAVAHQSLMHANALLAEIEKGKE
jgi:hypothetical protein